MYLFVLGGVVMLLSILVLGGAKLFDKSKSHY